MKTSIIILTYNKFDYTKQCIESIRQYTDRGSYEIIVVDNASTDETVEWLKQQEDIKLILNEVNNGFPKGCNQGIEISTGDSILLLNNDTVVTKNWLTNLTNCLYSDESIGAVGPVTNSAAYYMAIPVEYQTIEEMYKFAEVYNQADSSKWEERLKLIGFCMLIKRTVVNEIGLLDENFTPGNFEDDDYSIRVRKAGYKLQICKDTFIHHYGSVSFKENMSSLINVMSKNEKKFKVKWGMDSSSFLIHEQLINQIPKNQKEEITVLHIGCRAGATLLELKNHFKNSMLYGVEKNTIEAEEAKKIGEIYHCLDEINNGKFDVILYTDDALLDDKELEKIISLLNEDGYFMGDFVNSGFYLNLQQLIVGGYPFKGRTSVYSLSKLNSLFEKIKNETSYQITAITETIDANSQSFINEIQSMFGKGSKTILESTSFLVKAQKINHSLKNILKDIEEKEVINDELVLLNELDIDQVTSLVLNHSTDPIEVLQKIAIHNFYLENDEFVLPYLQKAFELAKENMDVIYNIAYVLSHYMEYELAINYINMLENKNEEINDLKEHIENALVEEKDKNLLKLINEAEVTRSDKTKVSIVLLAYNKLDYTKQCLDGLIKNTDPSSFELIIIDNGSTDSTEEYLSKIKNENIIVVRNEDNIGFVNACNQGAHFANCENIVFLSNDTIPLEGWLEEMIKTIEEEPLVGIVGAKLIYPSGILQEAGGIIWSDGNGWNYGRGDNPYKPEYNFIKEVDYCSGACLLVKKWIFNEVGGFDTRYSPAYYEDADLCFAVRNLGYRVLYNPKVNIIHYEGVTTGTDLSTGTKKYQVINHSKFVEKWSETLKEQFNPDILNVNEAAVRGQKKKNILIIDKILPWYDRAAGSLRLFNIIKILKKLNYFITFVAIHGEGQEKYIEELERMGVEVYALGSQSMLASGIKIDINQLLTFRKYNFVWISFYDIAEMFLESIKSVSPKSTIIIDTVDIHFLREMRMADVQNNNNIYMNALNTKERELNIYKKADLIITVTVEDKNILLKENPDLKIIEIPSIHDNLLQTIKYEERQDILFVGNFNHDPNVDAVNYFIQEIWTLVKQKNKDVKFYIVGNRSDEVFKNIDKDIIVTGYVPDIQDFLQKCKIAIAPIRYGAGMKGKISEALSSGIPVVTTKIGAEGMGLEHKVNVLIGENKYDFSENINRLYNDSQLWNRIVLNGKNHVQKTYSSEVVTKKLQNIFEETIF